MPELPEIETTRQGLLPFCEDKKIKDIIVRNPHLRWPVPENIRSECTGHTIITIQRRAKYLLFKLDNGTLLIHFGMSGSLRVVRAREEIKKHDHVDIVLTHGYILRYHDPRRFGCILWCDTDPEDHPLLKYLGPEPFDPGFTGQYLFTLSRKRTVAVKNLIMNSSIVVGVGNIYANEALFYAGIRPDKQAQTISAKKYEKLVQEIQNILKKAIKQGGTTLRDFVNGTGNPGYFAQQLAVYGREAQNCTVCREKITKIIIGQRASFYCPRCQK